MRPRVGLLCSALLSLLLVQACDRSQPVSPPEPEAVVVAAGAVAGPAVVISQVYGAGGNSGAVLTHDYVELFNRGTTPVDVSGWRIHYTSAAGNSWNNGTTLRAGAVIAPGGYFLVRMSGGTNGAPLPEPDDIGSVAMAAGAGKLVLTSGVVTLAGECPATTTYSAIVDYVAYGTTTNCATWGATPNLSTTLAAFRKDGGCTWSGSSANDFATAAPAPRNSASATHECSGDEEVATISVTPSSASISVGGTQAFTATAFSAGGQPVAASITWSSDDEAVVTIDAETGVASGVAMGSATITATANGVTGTASVLITPPPSFDVVISQVYGGGGNASATYTHDFVELFNRGSSSVDIGGWRVHYASAAGTSWSFAELPIGAGSLLPPGGYYLVQLFSQAEIGAPLPAPDATGTLNLAAGSGKVVLTLGSASLSGACPSGGDVLDRVNYGTANCSGEWGTTAALSNVLAALRNGNGCEKSGSVSADFTRGTPAPRNRASMRNVCEGPTAVTLTPAAQDLQIGATFTFTAAGLAADGEPTMASFTWSSSAPAIAAVDAATGQVTALAEGGATITATAPNGVSATAAVNVTPPPPATGLIITEFMADPDGADTLGEWFEIFNAGPDDVNLLGWQLRSGSSTALEVHTIAAPVIVRAGGFAVLGNNADALTNGGVSITYSYGGDIILNNSNTDWLVVQRPDGTTEDSVAYSARSGTTLVSPIWSPTPSTSRVLININLDNTLAGSSNWQNSTVEYGDGRNLGSPGWGAYGVAGPVASITVSPASASVLINGTRTYSSVALDALGKVSNETLTWTTTDAAIATVDPTTGTVTGHAEGIVTLTATSSTGVTGTASVVVVHPSSPASVTAGVSDPAWVPVGYEKRVFATVRDHEGNILVPDVTWSLSNPSLGEFFVSDGRTYLRTLGAGTVQVRATTTNGIVGTRTLTILPADAPTSAVYRNHLEFGMPTPGGTANDVIIEKRGFVSSYNPSTGGPNWVSWNLNATQFGSVPRCDCFSSDPAIPEPPARVVDSDFINGGYDRGHMVQSESRTSTEQENAATFLMSNILPQAPDNNQGSWLNFENYLNTLARQQGREIYVIAGGLYSAAPPTVNDRGKIHIPETTWKIAVILEQGQGLSAVTSPADVQVIAVNMPNLLATAQRNAPWQNFTTTVAALEAATGYDFLSALPEWIQRIVESGTQPPVAVAGGPYTGAEGAAITFDGSASSDPDAGDVLSFAWSFGDGTTGSGATPTHTYADNGVYNVRLIVSDQHGAADTTYTTATISNVAPVIVNLVTPPAAAIGASAAVSVSWTDAGSADTHTVTIDWGDGSSSTVAGSAGSATLTHSYAAAGFYTVSATVRDDDGGEATRSAAAAVAVYDPDGAVTGGGTFDAREFWPTGHGSMAFTVRNIRGAFGGTVEMHLNQAGMRFTADAIEWLVVEGSRATIRGTGRFRDDRASYTFTLTVQDGRAGSGGVRLIIENASGDVVFDNMPGSAAGSLAPLTGNVTVR